LLRQTGNLYLPQRVFNEVQTASRMAGSGRRYPRL
jgi:hypothetical protein